jgi:hypothetical protein
MAASEGLRANAIVDPSLLVTLNARVGDTLSLGYGRFKIIGTLNSIPGTPGVAEIIGPESFHSGAIPRRNPASRLLEALPNTGLSRAADGSGSGQGNQAVQKKLDKLQLRFQTVTESEAQATRSITSAESVHRNRWIDCASARWCW